MNSVILVTRGNHQDEDRDPDPGALKIYRFADGQLSPLADLRPGGRGGLGYGPRHLDFHPAQPWVYVSVESQNRLHMHMREGDVLSAEPLFDAATTLAQYDVHFPQMAGGLHVHPDGRAVYVTNRASATVDWNGKKVFRGGENNIAVFAIDPKTGAPTRIQNADTQSFHVRTFGIDPSGRLLVAASIAGMNVRDGEEVRHVPAALSVFRVGDDGRLSFVRTYEVPLGGKGRFQWWTGFLELP